MPDGNLDRSKGNSQGQEYLPFLPIGVQMVYAKLTPKPFSITPLISNGRDR